MRNSSLVPKLGKDAVALRMNGICYCFPADPLLALVDSGCAEPTLALFADPGTFATDESCRRALPIGFRYEIVGHGPGIVGLPAREGGHHFSGGAPNASGPDRRHHC